MFVKEGVSYYPNLGRFKSSFSTAKISDTIITH